MKPIYPSHSYTRLFIPIVIMMLIVGQTSTNSSKLEEYIGQHRQQYKLERIQSQIGQNKSNGVLIYVYNSVLYTQLCYQINPNNKQSIQKMLPSMLIKNSYNPIMIKQSLSNSQQQSIKCYQIFDKLMMIQKPTVISPIQEAQIDIGQLPDDVQVFPTQQNKNKIKKQISYLLAQYQLIHWIYKLGQQMTKHLSVLKQKQLSLTKIKKFSLLIQLTQSNPKSLKSQLSIRIFDIWAHSVPVGKNRLEKKLSGKGLHRTVTYTLKIGDKNLDINTEQCQIQLLQTLPSNTYIDVDELKGHGYRLQLVYGDEGDGISYINVEKPTYQSRQYQYRLIIRLSQWENIGVDQYQTKIPVHFRYPVPYHLQKPNTKTTNTKTTGAYQRYGGNQGSNKNNDIIEYVEVELYPTTNNKIVCYSQKNNLMNSNQTGIKYQLQEEYLGDRGSANIPVGDGMIRSTVNIITLGSEVVCAVLLVKMIRK